VRTSLPDDVRSFGATARRRLAALGGVDLGLRAETDRSLRDQVGLALTELGVPDLDVRGALDELLAAAEVCRAAGSLALPWPVVEDLLSIGGARLALVDLDRPRVDHGDLPGAWLGCDLDGRACELTMQPLRAAKLGPFLVPAEPGRARADVPADDVARHLVLGSWRLLGGLQAALGQVTEHVTVRKQFGRPLAAFQSVSFAVADATVAVRGLEELVKFTTWRLVSAPPPRRLVDATALRLHAAEKATFVLRTCHQLLGAVGFCDEHDVSVLDRHLQPLIRLPLPAEALAERLVPAVSRGDLETLFA
jgi:hypothetical protein